MIAIKDFALREQYVKLIYDKLMSYLYEGIFKPLFIHMKTDDGVVASNDVTVLIDALKSGTIFYFEDGFKSSTGKFSNLISKELIKLGAKYYKRSKMFKISKELLPPNVLLVIADLQRQVEVKCKKIDRFLEEVQKNMPYIIDSMIFNDEVIEIVDEVTGEIKKNARKRINVISNINVDQLYKRLQRTKKGDVDLIESDVIDEDIDGIVDLTVAQKRDIATNYTHNMQFYIKNWLPDRIEQLRRKVQLAVLMGYREDAVVDILMKEFKIEKNKAQFLAQNETSIFLAELKKVEYQDLGYPGFMWVTILDGKERERHRNLSGKYFTWDNPPVVDENGNTGLPGETYNCRCGLIPVRKDGIFYNKTDMQKYGNILSRYKKDRKKNGYVRSKK